MSTSLKMNRRGAAAAAWGSVLVIGDADADAPVEVEELLMVKEFIQVGSEICEMRDAIL